MRQIVSMINQSLSNCDLLMITVKSNLGADMLICLKFTVSMTDSNILIDITCMAQYHYYTECIHLLQMQISPDVEKPI